MVCQRLSTVHLGPSTVDRLTEVGLQEIAAIVQEAGGYQQGNEIVSRWLLLETDPEIIANQEATRAEEISAEFDDEASRDLDRPVPMEQGIYYWKYLNSNLENLIVYLILDYPTSSNSRQEDENNILLNNFFQSATAIVNGQIKDAIVTALAQGILSHLSNIKNLK